MCDHQPRIYGTDRWHCEVCGAVKRDGDYWRPSKETNANPVNKTERPLPDGFVLGQRVSIQMPGRHPTLATIVGSSRSINCISVQVDGKVSRDSYSVDFCTIIEDKVGRAGNPTP